LAKLANRINEHHRQAEAAIRSGLEHALEAGRLLVEAKTKCPHGGWGDWVESNCEFSQRTAQAYIRVAKRWPEIEAKAQSSADLTIDGALQLLADPRSTTHWDDRLNKVAAHIYRQPMHQAHRGAMATPWDGAFVVFGNRGDLEVPVFRDILAEHKCEILAYTAAGETELGDGTPCYHYWSMMVRAGAKLDKEDPADHLYALVWNAWVDAAFCRKPEFDEELMMKFLAVQDRVAREVLSEHSAAVALNMN